MRYGNTLMERRQEAEDSCHEAEDRMLVMDEIELDNSARDLANRKGQECIEALQAGLDAVYSALTGGGSIADYERERRERLRDYGD